MKDSYHATMPIWNTRLGSGLLLFQRDNYGGIMLVAKSSATGKSYSGHLDYDDIQGLIEVLVKELGNIHHGGE